MIRYGYNRQVDPPGPFVHVTLGRHDGTGDTAEWPAQLDTGADQTVVPKQAADDLRLDQVGQISIVGFGDRPTDYFTVLVRLAVRQLPALVLEALAGPPGTCVLLGRDVLNQYRIVLDGPQLALEID
jgi:predicted aspartyl protease